MAATEARESILMKALLAASNAHLEARIVVLTNCLRQAALTDDDVELGAIDAVVTALAELGPTHLAVLQALAVPHDELGLTHGPLPPTNRELNSLNRLQLLLVFPQLEGTVEPILAALQRHGLIDVQTPGGGMSLSKGPASPNYRIAPFGQRILDDLKTAASQGNR